jgi:hypothetical protein
MRKWIIIVYRCPWILSALRRDILNDLRNSCMCGSKSLENGPTIPLKALCPVLVDLRPHPSSWTVKTATSVE